MCIINTSRRKIGHGKYRYKVLGINEKGELVSPYKGLKPWKLGVWRRAAWWKSSKKHLYKYAINYDYGFHVCPTLSATKEFMEYEGRRFVNANWTPQRIIDVVIVKLEVDGFRFSGVWSDDSTVPQETWEQAKVVGFCGKTILNQNPKTAIKDAKAEWEITKKNARKHYIYN